MKKKTYMVHIVSQVVTYMTIEAINTEEAKKKAYEEMPVEFSLDSYDAELDKIIEVYATKENA